MTHWTDENTDTTAHTHTRVCLIISSNISNTRCAIILEWFSSFLLPKSTHCLRGVAILPRQKKNIWLENRVPDICSVFWHKYRKNLKIFSISAQNTGCGQILALWAFSNPSWCNTSHCAAIRAPPAAASSQDSASACSYLARKPAGECVIELHALWDVFTEVWAAAGLY